MSVERYARQPAGVLDDEPDWECCVAYLVGPALVTDHPERRRLDALRLAAAALRFAGRDGLADNVDPDNDSDA